MTSPRLAHIPNNLDLLWAPSIYFVQTGYSIYTLRQASRRSWRIGQRSNVVVRFLTYNETMQTSCLRLMGKKLLVSLVMEGKFSNLCGHFLYVANGPRSGVDTLVAREVRHINPPTQLRKSAGFVGSYCFLKAVRY